MLGQFFRSYSSLTGDWKVARTRRLESLRYEPKANLLRLTRRNRQSVKRAGFRARAIGIHCGLIPVNDIFVEAVLEKFLRVRLTVESA